MKPAPGKLVTRHVRLVEPIGEGAMGSVWLAEHLTLHTRVAVKFIAEDLARDNPDVLARFQREASASAQIKSSYVVQVFDHGLTADGIPYIVMELLEGESLGARLGRTGHVSLRQTAQVILQVGKALDRAHQLGIVHRDIKPDNIFLSTADDGLICKVLDFGIAKHPKLSELKGTTLPGTTVGTPEYMSREQVMTAAEPNATVDRWALAVVAYQCLTGVLPFDGETMAMVAVAICAGRFEPPSELCDDLPPGVDEWFARALNKEASERFDSCKEMALEFLRFVPKIDDEESWSQSGEFSLPPPSSPQAVAVSGVALSEADLLGVRPTEPELPPSSDAVGRRRETPTFSGAAAELGPPSGLRRHWRRKAVGGMGALALVVTGIFVGVALTTSETADDATSPGASAAAEETAAAGSSDSAASPPDTPTISATPASSVDELADAAAPDGAAEDDAGPRPRRWRPAPQYPYEPGTKRPRKDLGF